MMRFEGLPHAGGAGGGGGVGLCSLGNVSFIRVRSLQDQKNSKTFKDFFCLFSKTFQRSLRAISCRKIASVSTIFTW